MKLRILLLSVILCSSVISASDAQETLLSGELKHGGFGGPRIRFSSINGESAVFAGARGGWIINHQFVLGVGGYGLTTSIDAPVDPGEWKTFAPGSPAKDLKIGFGYGGLEIEYIHRWDRLVHLTASLLIGGGGLQYSDSDDDDSGYDEPNDELFVMEPAVNAELNITNWMRLDAGISYLLVNGVSFPGLSDSDLGGPGISLVLKFGKF